jgi:hypothetical protein
MDAHFVSAAGSEGVVWSVCGAAFAPVAVFNYGTRDATELPDPRVCVDCQQAAATLPNQRTPR